MLAKLIVEGKEFDIEIQDPKLIELVTPKKKTGYERPNANDKYWYVSGDGLIKSTNNSCPIVDDRYYETANCYSNLSVAENNARADNLMRQLRRFAVEHRKSELDYDCGVYTIHYDGKLITTIRTYSKDFGHILFDSSKTCNLAIETFYDELIWYFTEYKDSLWG